MVEANFPRQFIKRCASLSVSSVLGAMRKYILPLFSSDTAVVIVVAPPGKVTPISRALAEWAFECEVTRYGELPQTNSDSLATDANLEDQHGMHSDVRTIRMGDDFRRGIVLGSTQRSIACEGWRGRATERVKRMGEKAIEKLRAASMSRTRR